jgi:hypothetical protein
MGSEYGEVLLSVTTPRERGFCSTVVVVGSPLKKTSRTAEELEA